MKITKAGSIEPCCGKAKEYIKYFGIYEGTIVITASLNYDEYFDIIIDFCPFCGAKTEISEDE